MATEECAGYFTKQPVKDSDSNLYRFRRCGATPSLLHKARAVNVQQQATRRDPVLMKKLVLSNLIQLVVDVAP